jgi:hypothetical protein
VEGNPIESRAELAIEHDLIGAGDSQLCEVVFVDACGENSSCDDGNICAALTNFPFGLRSAQFSTYTVRANVSVPVRFACSALSCHVAS